MQVGRKSPDLNEISYADADCAFKVGYLTKCKNFANSIWRTAAILKIVFGYISTSDYRIDAKFCILAILAVLNVILLYSTKVRVNRIIIRRDNIAKRRFSEVPNLTW